MDMTIEVSVWYFVEVLLFGVMCYNLGRERTIKEARKLKK